MAERVARVRRQRPRLAGPEDVWVLRLFLAWVQNTPNSLKTIEKIIVMGYAGSAILFHLPHPRRRPVEETGG
jgi:hypothetical protein